MQISKSKRKKQHSRNVKKIVGILEQLFWRKRTHWQFATFYALKSHLML